MIIRIVKTVRIKDKITFKVFNLFGMWAEDDDRHSWDVNYPIKKRLQSINKLIQRDVF